MIGLPRSIFYYRSTAKPASLTEVERGDLIEDIQDELPGYGHRRMTHELHRRGYLANHKRMAWVMKVNGLGLKPRKRYVRTTDSSHDSPIYPNLYRNVIPSRPGMVWVAGFTYIRIAAGFCYLAVTLDAGSRKVVGYALSRRIDTPHNRTKITFHETDTSAEAGDPLRVPPGSQASAASGDKGISYR
jgi:putative transposase